MVANIDSVQTQWKPLPVPPTPIKVALDGFLDQNPALNHTRNLHGFDPLAAPTNIGGSSHVHKATLILPTNHNYMTAEQQKVIQKHIAKLPDRLQGSQVAIKVAVKVFRFIPAVDGTNQLIRIWWNELNKWSKLDHPYVLPLLGVTCASALPGFISEYMEMGTIAAYLDYHTEADRMEITKNIADGLAYLHGEGIIHSDIKPDNILATPDGRPQIADLGNSRPIDFTNGMTMDTSGGHSGTPRWMAVEFFALPDDLNSSVLAKNTEASDVWAFGMVIYQIATGEVPYSEIRGGPPLIKAIANYRLPKISTSHEQWLAPLFDICRKCWGRTPKERPCMHFILSELRRLLGKKACSPCRDDKKRCDRSDDSHCCK